MAVKRTSVNLSDVTQRQIEELDKIAGYEDGITDLIRRAIDRMWYDEIGQMQRYREELGKMAQSVGVSVERAARDLLDNLSGWGEAALVVYDDGSCDAVPAAHLTDISWSGRGHVDSHEIYRELSDITGDPRPWGELDPQEQDWAVSQIVDNI